MSEQELIERMARAVAQSKHGNTMGVALDALREAIPGLNALIAGTGVVVPREPTEAMLNAAHADHDFWTTGPCLRGVLRRAIAAAGDAAPQGTADENMMVFVTAGDVEFSHAQGPKDFSPRAMIEAAKGK